MAEQVVQVAGEAQPLLGDGQARQLFPRGAQFGDRARQPGVADLAHADDPGQKHVRAGQRRTRPDGPPGERRHNRKAGDCGQSGPPGQGRYGHGAAEQEEHEPVAALTVDDVEQEGQGHEASEEPRSPRAGVPGGLRREWADEGEPQVQAREDGKPDRTRGQPRRRRVRPEKTEGRVGEEHEPDASHGFAEGRREAAVVRRRAVHRVGTAAGIRRTSCATRNLLPSVPRPHHANAFVEARRTLPPERSVRGGRSLLLPPREMRGATGEDRRTRIRTGTPRRRPRGIGGTHGRGSSLRVRAPSTSAKESKAPPTKKPAR